MSTPIDEKSELAILILLDQVNVASKNKQNFVVDQLLAKINRIRKRAQKRVN